jgi:glycosyltransferase involved in cell wall biosynthesis
VRIAALGNEFVKWGGGIDFLRIVLNGIRAVRDQGVTVDLLLPQETIPTQIRAGLGSIRRSLHDALEGRPVRWQRPGASFGKDLEKSFEDYGKEVSLVRYRNSPSGLMRALRELRSDVIIPAFGSLGADFPVPWVGYVYDFQHRYLPHLFTEAERRGRDEWFRKVLGEARVVIANARAVREDARRFFPGLGEKVVPLPFAATATAEWFMTDIEAVQRKYSVQAPYFMVCSQFWVHKDHPTAFRALRAFLDARPGTDARLVCTGLLHEPRDAGHVTRLRRLVEDLGLADRVAFLGYIPKGDQTALMRGAMAVVQPTLFEGGPGGGAAWDAIAVGTPVIVSDIPVNLEIANEEVVFFKSGDPGDLARAMLDLPSSPPGRRSPAELLRRGHERARELGRVLVACSEMACREGRERRTQRACRDR